MSEVKDLTGQTFGRLVVLERAGSNKHGNAMWKCQCSCGNIVVVRSQKLILNTTKSCGCLKKDISKTIRRTHGETGCRLYRCWQHMKKRCNNPNCKFYCNYGARGITVCQEWNKYEAFRDWSLANGYTDNLTIDRINNDAGYSPDNCRWVDRKIQNNNKRSNHIVEFDNERHTISEWSEITGINSDVIQMRINKLGWPMGKALTTPVRPCNKSTENKV